MKIKKLETVPAFAPESKPAPAREPRDAVWFPSESNIKDRVSKLASLIESELPIQVKVYPYAAVLLAIDEAINRRTQNAKGAIGGIQNQTISLTLFGASTFHTQESCLSITS